MAGSIPLQAQNSPAPAAPDSGGPLKNLYISIEDGYYGFATWLEAHGIPFGKFFVEPIEKNGIPSFPIFAFLILLLLAGAAFAASSLLVPKTANLAIMVGDEAGPIDGASVTIVGEKFSQTLLTAAGRAEFKSLPSGKKATVSVSAAGYKDFNQSITIGARSTMSFTLEADTVTMSVRVYNFEGQPIANAELDYSYSIEGGDAVTGTATTDEDGKADITVPSDSSLTVTARAEGYESRSSQFSATSGTKKITLKSIPVAPVIPPITEPTEYSRLTVNTKDDDGNSLNAHVSVYDSSTTELLAQRDAEIGSAEFTVIKVGTEVRILAELDGYKTASKSVTLSRATTVEMILAPQDVATTGLSSTITVKDAAGKPLKAAVLAIISYAPETMNFSRVKEAKDASTLTASLAPNVFYYAVAYKPGYLTQKTLRFSAGDSRAITMSAATDANTANLSVNVVDEDGKAPASATLAFFDRDLELIPPFDVKTVSGKASFAGFARSQFTVRASSPPQKANASVDLSDGEGTANITMLYPRATLRVLAKEFGTNTPITTFNATAYYEKAFRNGSAMDSCIAVNAESCDLWLRIDKKLNLTITSSIYRPYYSAVAANSLKANNVTEHSASMVLLSDTSIAKIEFKQAENAEGTVVTSLISDAYYLLKFAVYFADGTDSAGTFIKLASPNNSVVAHLVNFSYSEFPVSANGSTRILDDATHSLSPSFCTADFNSVNSPYSLAWADLAWGFRGVRELAVWAKADANVGSAASAVVSFRAYATENGKYFRDPFDARLNNSFNSSTVPWCFAQVKTKEFPLIACGSFGQACCSTRMDGSRVNSCDGPYQCLSGKCQYPTSCGSAAVLCGDDNLCCKTSASAKSCKAGSACPLDSANTAQCMPLCSPADQYCDSSDSGRGGMCRNVDCGKEGTTCCGGSQCGDGLTCDPASKECSQCGAFGQKCCSYEASAPEYACSPSLQCNSAACTPSTFCGSAQNECTGATVCCADPEPAKFGACTLATNCTIPKSCTPTCGFDKYCDASDLRRSAQCLACDKNHCPFGKPGGLCDASNPCLSGNNVCTPVAGSNFGVCKPCGEENQGCCAQDSCGAGLLCAAGAAGAGNVCSQCGDVGEQCCPQGGTTPECRSGYCMDLGGSRMCTAPCDIDEPMSCETFAQTYCDPQSASCIPVEGRACAGDEQCQPPSCGANCADLRCIEDACQRVANPDCGAEGFACCLTQGATPVTFCLGAGSIPCCANATSPSNQLCVSSGICAGLCPARCDSSAEAQNGIACDTSVPTPACVDCNFAPANETATCAYYCNVSNPQDQAYFSCNNPIGPSYCHVQSHTWKPIAGEPCSSPQGCGGCGLVCLGGTCKAPLECNPLCVEGEVCDKLSDPANPHCIAERCGITVIGGACANASVGGLCCRPGQLCDGVTLKCEESIPGLVLAFSQFQGCTSPDMTTDTSCINGEVRGIDTTPLPNTFNSLQNCNSQRCEDRYISIRYRIEVANPLPENTLFFGFPDNNRNPPSTQSLVYVRAQAQTGGALTLLERGPKLLRFKVTGSGPWMGVITMNASRASPFQRVIMGIQGVKNVSTRLSLIEGTLPLPPVAPTDDFLNCSNLSINIRTRNGLPVYDSTCNKIVLKVDSFFPADAIPYQCNDCTTLPCKACTDVDRKIFRNNSGVLVRDDTAFSNCFNFGPTPGGSAMRYKPYDQNCPIDLRAQANTVPSATLAIVFTKGYDPKNNLTIPLIIDNESFTQFSSHEAGVIGFKTPYLGESTVIRPLSYYGKDADADFDERLVYFIDNTFNDYSANSMRTTDAVKTGDYATSGSPAPFYGPELYRYTPQYDPLKPPVSLTAWYYAGSDLRLYADPKDPASVSEQTPPFQAFDQGDGSLTPGLVKSIYDTARTTFCNDNDCSSHTAPWKEVNFDGASKPYTPLEGARTLSFTGRCEMCRDVNKQSCASNEYCDDEDGPTSCSIQGNCCTRGNCRTKSCQDMRGDPCTSTEVCMGATIAGSSYAGTCCSGANSCLTKPRQAGCYYVNPTTTECGHTETDCTQLVLSCSGNVYGNPPLCSTLGADWSEDLGADVNAQSTQYCGEHSVTFPRCEVKNGATPYTFIWKRVCIIRSAAQPELQVSVDPGANTLPYQARSGSFALRVEINNPGSVSKTTTWTLTPSSKLVVSPTSRVESIGPGVTRAIDWIVSVASDAPSPQSLTFKLDGVTKFTKSVPITIPAGPTTIPSIRRSCNYIDIQPDGTCNINTPRQSNPVCPAGKHASAWTPATSTEYCGSCHKVCDLRAADYADLMFNDPCPAGDYICSCSVTTDAAHPYDYNSSITCIPDGTTDLSCVVGLQGSLCSRDEDYGCTGVEETGATGVPAGMMCCRGVNSCYSSTNPTTGYSTPLVCSNLAPDSAGNCLSIPVRLNPDAQCPPGTSASSPVPLSSTSYCRTPCTKVSASKCQCFQDNNGVSYSYVSQVTCSGTPTQTCAQLGGTTCPVIPAGCKDGSQVISSSDTAYPIVGSMCCSGSDSCGTPPAGDVTATLLSASPVSSTPNGNFDVRVNLSNSGDAAVSYPFTLIYPPTVFEVRTVWRSPVSVPARGYVVLQWTVSVKPGAITQTQNIQFQHGTQTVLDFTVNIAQEQHCGDSGREGMLCNAPNTNCIGTLRTDVEETNCCQGDCVEPSQGGLDEETYLKFVMAQFKEQAKDIAQKTAFRRSYDLQMYCTDAFRPGYPEDLSDETKCRESLSAWFTLVPTQHNEQEVCPFCNDAFRHEYRTPDSSAPMVNDCDIRCQQSDSCSSASGYCVPLTLGQEYVNDSGTFSCALESCQVPCGGPSDYSLTVLGDYCGDPVECLSCPASGLRDKPAYDTYAIDWDNESILHLEHGSSAHSYEMRAPFKYFAAAGQTFKLTTILQASGNMSVNALPFMDGNPFYSNDILSGDSLPAQCTVRLGLYSMQTATADGNTMGWDGRYQFHIVPLTVKNNWPKEQNNLLTSVQEYCGAVTACNLFDPYIVDENPIQYGDYLSNNNNGFPRSVYRGHCLANEWPVVPDGAGSTYGTASAYDLTGGNGVVPTDLRSYTGYKFVGTSISPTGLESGNTFKGIVSNGAVGANNLRAISAYKVGNFPEGENGCNAFWSLAYGPYKLDADYYPAVFELLGHKTDAGNPLCSGQSYDATLGESVFQFTATPTP